MLDLFNKKDEPDFDLIEMKKTSDYALISVPQAHKYIIVNQYTSHVEVEEDKLPTAIYQLHSLQDSLDQLREKGQYEENSNH